MFRLTILTKRTTTRFVNGQSVSAIEFGMQHDAGDPVNQGTFPGIFKMYIAPNDARNGWDIGDTIECNLTVP